MFNCGFNLGFNRSRVGASILVGVAALLAGCAGGGDVDSVVVTPTSQSITGGSTAQFIATGIETHVGGATKMVDLTKTAIWASSATSIATINSAGLATGVAAGTTTITATTNGFGGTIVGSATLTVTSGVTAQESLLSISVLPVTQSLNTVGETGQFIALGTFSTAPTMRDITKTVTWSSSDVKVATIIPGGLATAYGAGTTTILAVDSTSNSDGTTVVGSATLTVTTGAAQESLLSIAVLPASQSVDTDGETGQFIAFGTFSAAPTVRDITKTVTWTSSDVKVATINSSGLATAYSAGVTAILAVDSTSNSDGTVISGIASFTDAADMKTPPQLATLTIYNAGADTTDWTVSSPSATGVPDEIHCGPGPAPSGGTVCTGTYPVNSLVVVTATQGSAGTFGGFSSNCVPTAAISAGGPNSCTVTMSNNEAVGAIFN